MQMLFCVQDSHAYCSQAAEWHIQLVLTCLAPCRAQPRTRQAALTQDAAADDELDVRLPFLDSHVASALAAGVLSASGLTISPLTKGCPRPAE